MLRVFAIQSILEREAKDNATSIYDLPLQNTVSQRYLLENSKLKIDFHHLKIRTWIFKKEQLKAALQIFTRKKSFSIRIIRQRGFTVFFNRLLPSFINSRSWIYDTDLRLWIKICLRKNHFVTQLSNISFYLSTQVFPVFLKR